MPSERFMNRDHCGHEPQCQTATTILVERAKVRWRSRFSVLPHGKLKLELQHVCSWRGYRGVQALEGMRRGLPINSTLSRRPFVVKCADA
jgi:hypothetical protein